METLSGILLIAALVVGAILILKILTKPIRWIFKLLLNAAFGFVLLFLVNFFGDPVGIYIGVNFVNALVAGFLGVPGVILLVLLTKSPTASPALTAAAFSTMKKAAMWAGALKTPPETRSFWTARAITPAAARAARAIM